MIDRYGDIIPDVARFCETMQRPLVKTGWINPLKTRLAVVQTLLPSDVALFSSPVWASAYQYQGATDAIQALVKLGYWHWQEMVSMLPPLVLNPQPGERVLDLCAAPGNKTAQCAVLMKNQGTLVANDINYHRLKALGKNLKRLGVLNASLTQYAGVDFPAPLNFFDKILVDAPCSCEGTARKNRHVQVNPRLSRHKAQVQIELLTKAMTLCRPGGQILYATCTFAPEENEQVIQTLLDQWAGQVRLVPLTLPSLNTSPGLDRWQGQCFDRQLAHCLRIWPGLNDTGGFFLALLEKQPVPVNLMLQVSHVVPCEVNDLAIAMRAVQWPGNWFEQHRWVRSPMGNDVYVIAADHLPPANVSVDAMGLRVYKHSSRQIATDVCHLLPLTMAHVCLSAEQVFNYVQRVPVMVTQMQLRQFNHDRRLVLVTYNQQGLGFGLLDLVVQQYQLTSLFPKH